MKRTWILIGVAIAALTAGIAVYLFVLTDRSGRPYCHKQVDMAFHDWQDLNKTKQFPNVNGCSTDSLAEIKQHLGGVDLSDSYMYVPGLKRDDPGDLVLMYLRQPTRWTWHGERPSIFRDTAWILVPVDMKFYGPGRDAGPGEFSERVSFKEFRRRLAKTLEFLKENQRPHWKEVVKEHRDFLQSLEHETKS